MSKSLDYKAKPIWTSLGEGFSDEVKAARFPQHILRYRNTRWSDRLGLGPLSDDEWIEHFGKFLALPDNLPQPQALRYHGHQFTHYNPQLGDGRGFLFAQLEDPKTGRVLDLGTKGSGQTPYSRQGDGRLTLKGAVREALATAYLEYQGVHTSKTFSIIETGERLERNDEPSPTRSAVLVRLSESHIRFGSFQRLAYFHEKDLMKKLRDYTLEHYYPGVNPDQFFSEVCRNVARTTAQWMIHGFVHGVLNTDNMNITGESFDYGPYRFLPHYDSQFTAAYFDRESLYAYGRQPHMVLWNLQQLAESLQLIDPNKENYDKGYEVFKRTFEDETFKLFAKKIHCEWIESEKLKELFFHSLEFLDQSKVPYEAFFRDLAHWIFDESFSFENHHKNSSLNEIAKLVKLFKSELSAPLSSPLQTMLIDEIEDIWDSIDKNDNWEPFNKKLMALRK